MLLCFLKGGAADMRTKDVLEALNVSRERIKYYKKEKVFAPEKGSVNGRADYTNND